MPSMNGGDKRQVEVVDTRPGVEPIASVEPDLLGWNPTQRVAGFEVPPSRRKLADKPGNRLGRIVKNGGAGGGGDQPAVLGEDTTNRSQVDLVRARLGCPTRIAPPKRCRRSPLEG